MIRKIVSLVKKWASARPARAAVQEKVHLGERELQAQQEAYPNAGPANDPAERDEDTAKEVVATWNLLNPP